MDMNDVRCKARTWLAAFVDVCRIPAACTCTVSRARWPTVMPIKEKCCLGFDRLLQLKFFFSDGRPVDLDRFRMIWEYHRSTLDSSHIKYTTWIEFTQWTPAFFCQPLWVPYSHPLPNPERLHLDDARAFVEESDLSFDFVWLEPGMSGALVDRVGWETRCLWTWAIHGLYMAILPYPPKRQFSTLTGKIFVGLGIWIAPFQTQSRLIRPPWAELFGGEQRKNLTGSFRPTKKICKN